MSENNLNPTREEFEQMLDAVMLGQKKFEDTVMDGTITALDRDFVTVDVGLKMEGRISRKEFIEVGDKKELALGDVVKVFVERLEDMKGEAVYSREMARKEEVWVQIEEKFSANERVEGIIFGRVKGGFTVELGGATAFLPGSQVDLRPVRDISPLMDITQPFKILKMDRKRGNIVVSRRAILEEDRSEHRTEMVKNLAEGDIKEGVVKNLTPYGAFVELVAGVDGLLHVTDMSWSRINHPSELLSINDKIEVKIIKINQATDRISLGIKQLHPDPWDGITQKYQVGVRVKGTVSNVTDYGAFVDLGDGVEGLVHVTEMSWIKKNAHPNKIISVGQEVEVMVLEVDEVKRRISLGIKQCLENPWDSIVSKELIGTVIEGEVRSIAEFGIFVEVFENIDGMIHLSDIDWDKSGDEAIKEYEVGQKIKVKVLDIDLEKERVTLGIKQISGDPFDKIGSIARGDNVTVTVSEVLASGIEVKVDEDNILKAFIKKSELSIDRNDQRPDRFAVGDRVDVMVTSIDRPARRIYVSIKERELAEEKKAVDQYGSTSAGASLGDVLGPSLSANAQKNNEKSIKKNNDDEDKK